MKRVVILIASLAVAIGACAQSGNAGKELEKALHARDSVINVLAEHRANYAKSDSARVTLAPVILSLEKEATRLQATYDQILQSISRRDTQSALVAYEQSLSGEAVKSAKGQLSNGGGLKSYGPERHNMVYNAIFAERLSAAEHATLLTAQQHEAKIAEFVAGYMSKYSDLLALQRQYIEASTRKSADNVAQQFDALEKTMVIQEKVIKNMWSSLYYDKVYTYDLLMERMQNSAMLNFSIASADKANQEISQNSGKYQSDVLVEYYTRKRSLVEYELNVASSLNLKSSCDSLTLVLEELSNSNYRISKLSLPHRNFIVYENISLKTPSVYNSRNPIPEVAVYDAGIVYRVRVWLNQSRPTLSALRGVVPISYSDKLHRGCYAHFAGGFQSEKEAQDAVIYLKKLGFRDPVIAVWVDGVYYPTIDDMRISEYPYVLEISGVDTITDEMKSRINAYNSNYSISRSGSTIVVGVFDARAQAEVVAAELKALNDSIQIEIVKKN